jgi:hypothetical protein
MLKNSFLLTVEGRREFLYGKLSAIPFDVSIDVVRRELDGHMETIDLMMRKAMERMREGKSNA